MTIELHQADCVEWMRENENRKFSLCFFSPPYCLKTERYPGARRKMTAPEWVEWITEAVYVASRVTTGFICVVSNNPVVDANVIPVNEMLTIAASELGLGIERKIIWSKNAAPSRHQGKWQWFSNAYEEVLCFYRHPRPAVWNWEAIASPMKYQAGGNFRQRNARGERKQGGQYPKSKLARPKDVLRVTVGGGHMGHKLAHKQEACFPEKLAEPFVLALTNPGDTVFDPFCGSSTVGAVCQRHGRNYVGVDLRDSQITLSKERLGIT